MKSAVENLSPTRVKLTVEVPFEELKPSIDAAYKTIGQQVQVPGFRRGKVPARIIDQRIGKGAVLQEAVNEALPQFYGQAIDETGLKPLSQPEVDVTEIPLEDGQQLAFAAELDVRPTIEMPDFTSLTVDVDDVEVTEEDVNANLSQLQERFGSLVGVDRAARTGDFVSIDLAASIDGEEIDSVSGVSYEIGSGNMLEGMDDHLVGVKADESTTFTAPLAGGDRAGQEAEITITVLSVKERELPELDDEFAQLASEFDTIDELRADVTAQTERAKKFEQGTQARDKVLAQLLETVEIPLPEALVEAEVESHFAEGSEEGHDTAEHREEVAKNVREAMKGQFLLDAIAEEREVQVGQQELIEYLVMQAQQYGMDPNQFAQIMDSNGQVPAMVSEVARRKALATVLEDITIKDASGNVVNLSDLDVEVEGAEDEAADDAEATPAEKAPATKSPAKKAPAKKAADEAAVSEDSAEGAEEAKPAKKAPATKSPAKKAPAKKSADEAAASEDSEGAKPAKKAPAKKSPAKKAPAKKAAKDEDAADA
ncbi:trigger factor [Arsenicicoccus sp. MKL-02]|uniref:Trigger factor n=1 Tax=Arsenicicoccus cauae TaxID=2663847 RepID=A0A6I3IBJ7_9MICO|nr:trigger factor [Arsenicicoccus cauae]MTB71252.1 trigger factor [Arsenicicoccus cauae]